MFVLCWRNFVQLILTLGCLPYLVMYMSRHFSVCLFRDKGWQFQFLCQHWTEIFCINNSSNRAISPQSFSSNAGFFSFSLTIIFWFCAVCHPSILSLYFYALGQTTAHNVLTITTPQILPNFASYWYNKGVAIVVNATDNGQCINILGYAAMNHRYILGADS